MSNIETLKVLHYEWTLGKTSCYKQPPNAGTWIAKIKER